MEAISCRSLLLLSISPAFSGVYWQGQTYSTLAGTHGQLVELPIGGGGFLTQLDVECDQGYNQCNNTGTSSYMVCDDTYGGWIGKPGAWKQIWTQASIPSNAAALCLDAVLAPSNTSHVYAFMSDGNIYTSKNQGATWTLAPGWSADTGVSQLRDFSHNIAVSPCSENIAYVGTFASGVQYTLDGGTTFHQISTGTVPASGSNKSSLAAFDPSDATCNTIYLTSYGNGIYKCTSASTSPSCSVAQATGQPTKPLHLRVDPKGGVWEVDFDGGSCDNQCGSIYNLVSGTWTT